MFNPKSITEDVKCDVNIFIKNSLLEEFNVLLHKR